MWFIQRGERACTPEVEVKHLLDKGHFMVYIDEDLMLKYCGVRANELIN